MYVDGRTSGSSEINVEQVSTSSSFRFLSLSVWGIQQVVSGTAATSLSSAGVDMKLMSGVGMIPCVRRWRLAFDRTANFLLQLCTGHVNAIADKTDVRERWKTRVIHSRFAPEWTFMCVARPLGRGNHFLQVWHWCIFGFLDDDRARRVVRTEHSMSFGRRLEPNFVS